MMLINFIFPEQTHSEKHLTDTVHSTIGFDILTKVPHIRRPKSGEIIKLEEVGKSEIFLTYIRSALFAID